MCHPQQRFRERSAAPAFLGDRLCRQPYRFTRNLYEVAARRPHDAEEHGSAGHALVSNRAALDDAAFVQISHKGDDAAFDEVHMFDRGIRLDQHLLVVEPHAFHRRSEPLAICAGESRKNLVSIRHWAFRDVSNV